jgi:helix-turn-helix protein
MPVCQAPQSVKKWLKSYEVKKILNISTGTLQNLRSNGTLPYTKIGGLIYYDAELINKVMAGQKDENNQSSRPISKKH